MKTFVLTLSIAVFTVVITKSQDVINLRPLITSQVVDAPISDEIMFRSPDADPEILPILFEGSWNPESKECRWKPNYAEAMEFGVSPGDFLFTTVDTVFSFTVKNDISGELINKAIIVAVTKFKDALDLNDCHGCSVAMSLIGLELDSLTQSYRVDYFEKYAGSFGSWGEFGEASLVQIGKQDYCLKVFDSYLGMGLNNETVYLFLRGKQVLSYASHADNGGAASDESQVFDFNTAMTVDIEKGEFVLSRTGSELVHYDGEKYTIRPVNEKVTYKLVEGDVEKICK